MRSSSILRKTFKDGRGETGNHSIKHLIAARWARHLNLEVVESLKGLSLRIKGNALKLRINEFLGSRELLENFKNVEQLQFLWGANFCHNQ